MSSEGEPRDPEPAAKPASDSHVLSAPPGSRTASVPSGLRAGLVIADKYRLVRRLGTGAMGEVWAARHETLDEEVAIKLVVRTVDHDDGTSCESRFLLEARVAASLSRKTRHIVAVTDHGRHGSLGYLVMELLSGESLARRIERTGPLPLAAVAPIITQIARGLSVAHAEGVVHRDLKPSNVFVVLDEDGVAVAKVLDFGIAKLRRQDQASPHSTRRGFLLGTPAYMSPEQARGKPVDHRADVWALAVIAYHMLTGEFPFDGETGEELFQRLRRAQSTPISQRCPDLPPIVNDFFLRAFAEHVEDRFQSAAALAGAFEHLDPAAAQRPRPPSSLPPPSVAVVDHDFGQVGLDVPSPGTSMVAAGVPRRRHLLPVVVAVSLMLSVLSLSGLILTIYYERDPVARQAAAAPLVATTAPVVSTASPPTGLVAMPPPVVLPTLVPPPEPTLEPTAPLANATPPVRSSRADRPGTVATRGGSVATPVPVPTVEAATIPAAARARRPIDKSDVF